VNVLAVRGGSPVRARPWPKWPEHGERELRAVERALNSGSWGGYPAPNTETRRFQAAFAQYIGTKHAVLAANGTVTLEVALRALGIGAGDEVIVPALTWVATAGAAAYVNAVPVFADVDPHTLCIDPKSAESLIGPRTRAIIAVHLGSAMADVDALRSLCAASGLKLIEDCAHAHGARWNDRVAGSFGTAGSFSFQSSKLLTSGEGGAITTNDDLLAQRCQSLINCGRKEPGYDQFEGPVFGWNNRITELQAALLGEQLTRLDEQHRRRVANVHYLEAKLIELDIGLSVQHRDKRITKPTFYQLVLLYDAARWRGVSRDRFVEALEAEGVPADGAFYTPIPDRVGEIFPLTSREYPAIRERYGEALDPQHVECPVARKAAFERTIWLHHSLLLGSTKDIDDIIHAIVKIREHLDELV
jgi:dTDP-4-amino-4,6-dideoxygalactose transaminase